MKRVFFSNITVDTALKAIKEVGDAFAKNRSYKWIGVCIGLLGANIFLIKTVIEKNLQLVEIKKRLKEQTEKTESLASFASIPGDFYKQFDKFLIQIKELNELLISTNLGNCIIIQEPKYTGYPGIREVPKTQTFTPPTKRSNACEKFFDISLELFKEAQAENRLLRAALHDKPKIVALLAEIKKERAVLEKILRSSEQAQLIADMRRLILKTTQREGSPRVDDQRAVIEELLF